MSTFVWSGIEDEALETFAFGRTWRANIPQEVNDSEGFDVEESERIDNPDGSFRLVNKKRRVSFVEKLRQHPCFSEVDGEQKVHKKLGRPQKYPNAAEEHGRRELVIGE